MYKVDEIRKDFPILSKTIYGKPLVYLDNAATTQKCKQVLDKIQSFYREENANIHRGVHHLSNRSTSLFEEARQTVKNFLNARFAEEIIFTKGTTDSINILAFSFGETYLNPGDEILLAQTEHHSNIVPWQMLCNRKQAHLRVIPADKNGELDIEAYKKCLNPKVKLVTIAHVTNALGIINPIEEMIADAHRVGAKVLIDGAQAVQHLPANVCRLDCDFYVFSAHKVYAPTGIGVLYGKKEYLETLSPCQGGGDMIKTVSFAHTEYADLPFKFEAGTVNYVGAIALAEALNYMEEKDRSKILSYETELLHYAEDKLLKINGLQVFGQVKNKASVISFLLKNIHPYDTGVLLDKMGIAVRTGTHCAEPTMKHFGIQGTVRMSIAMYNTKEEIDILCEGLAKVQKMLG
ncbi:MAG: cysteine desulfurase CsdA [Bacteroidia bacterium]|nr:MAG: cysteine desulfurase CsdA [Bacteroidia bacterium]